MPRRAMRASPRSISVTSAIIDDRRARMLILNGISAGYGSFEALFDVSLEVAAGETVGVVGPNGAGKTTLMRVISGLIRATAGDLVLEGRSLNHLPAHQIVPAGIAQV